MKNYFALVIALSSFASPAYANSETDKLCEGPAEKKAIEQAAADAVDPENPPTTVTKFETKVSGKSYIVSLESGPTYLVSTKVITVTRHFGDESIQLVCEAISAKDVR